MRLPFILQHGIKTVYCRLHVHQNVHYKLKPVLIKMNTHLNKIIKWIWYEMTKNIVVNGKKDELLLFLS